ncbi:MAG: PorT family protein, partial [Saprospiraceae bacterium]|nr:PorT family protein [Saprospiraceae bacterium]
MNLLNYANKAPRKPWLYLIGIFILLIKCLPAQAQEPLFAVPSWWFGAASGANVNIHDGTNQRLNKNFATPVAFGKGNGVGLYLAPLLEYHRPYAKWGFMLQAGYDNRQGTFEEVVSSCNCPADLDADLSYISVEPSLRFSPILTKLNFYLYAGPRLAFNLDKSFTYLQGNNPDTPEQTPAPAVKGDFDNIEKMRVSLQIGAGYDIPISSQLTKTQWVVSPFVAYHPSLGQSPRSTESWGLSTLRVGAALKLGHGRKLETFPEAISPEPNVRFYVSAPAN